MWFASLDTNSPWGTTFPLSVPVQPKKEVGVLDSKQAKVGPQQAFANDFVQISSNRHWNSKNLDFGHTQKKATKFPAPEISIENESESSSDEETTTLNLYKTEPCRSFEETGSCRYGLKCQFAHGKVELRPVSRHPKYKTEVCKTFHTIGTCPYGKRCRFIHTEAPATSCPSTPLKTSLLKSEPKAPATKPNHETFSAAGWSNNWGPSFPHATLVNMNSVAKGVALKTPVEQPSSVHTSKESHERRSRLGIFQQICS